MHCILVLREMGGIVEISGGGVIIIPPTRSSRNESFFDSSKVESLIKEAKNKENEVYSWLMEEERCTPLHWSSVHKENTMKIKSENSGMDNRNEKGVMVASKKTKKTKSKEVSRGKWY